MTEKNKQAKEQPVYLASPNNPEQVRIGDIFFCSEILNAKQLLELALGALENKSIKKYLDLVKQRRTKLTGSAFG